MDGYEKFFKQARKASGLSGGDRNKAVPRAKSGAAKNSGSTKFSLDSRRELDPGAVHVSVSSRKGGSSPEERLRQELANRLNAKKKKALRKKQEFPVFSAVCVVIALVSCGVGYYYPGAYEFLAKHVEIGVFSSATASEDAKGKVAGPGVSSAAAVKPEEKAAVPEAATGEKPAATKDAVATEGVPNIRNWTPEELSFFNKLNDRKKELDLRESELSKLEEELHKQKAELDEKIKQLESMRTEISKTLKTRVATDQAKVDKLVEFYSSMKPQQAAKVIETVNEDLAVEVLDKMKKKNAAEIMNMMDSKKARRLSELLTGYQRTPAASEPTKEAAPGAESAESEEE